MVSLESTEILIGSPDVLAAVVQQPDGYVALAAQEPTNGAGAMTVIDHERAVSASRPSRKLAYRAFAFLGCEESVEGGCASAAAKTGSYGYIRPVTNVLIAARLAPYVEPIRPGCVTREINDRSYYPAFTTAFGRWLWLTGAFLFPLCPVFAFFLSPTGTAPNPPRFPWAKITLKLNYRLLLTALRTDLGIHENALVCRGLE